MKVKIRRTTKSDLQEIIDTVAAAFNELGQKDQENVDLVLDLLADPTARPRLSLAAFVQENIVGHILFTKVLLSNSNPPVSSAILAPLAVKPAYQNQGIGGLLITDGIQELKDMVVDLLFVLGHPEYYPKFGFIPAGNEGFEAPFPIPQEFAAAWMVQELSPGAIHHNSGKVKCAEALNDPRYW